MVMKTSPILIDAPTLHTWIESSLGKAPLCYHCSDGSTGILLPCPVGYMLYSPDCRTPQPECSSVPCSKYLSPITLHHTVSPRIKWWEQTCPIWAPKWNSGDRSSGSQVLLEGGLRHLSLLPFLHSSHTRSGFSFSLLKQICTVFHRSFFRLLF